MNLENPTAIYTAAGNVDAMTIEVLLRNSGIVAYAVEDISGNIILSGGAQPLLKPKIYVEKEDAARARQIVLDHEPGNRRQPSRDRDVVKGTCESCGETSSFPPELDGKIAKCPVCDDYMDVGELKWGDGTAIDESFDE